MKKTVLLFLLAAVVPALSAQSVYDNARLLEIKERTAALADAEIAADGFLRDADSALTTGIVPVTEKSICAVSGDPHDYVSMGPYWWRDPGQPDGMPYIRLDGERNPESALLDRPKMEALLRTVRALSIAYFCTEDEKYARKAVENLRIWFLDPQTRMNPNLCYAQMIPGHEQGRGRAIGIIDAYLFVELIECVGLLEPSEALAPEDMQGIKRWFSDLTEWLLSNDIGGQLPANNIGTAFDVQVAAFSLFTGREALAREVIDRFAATRIFTQIEPDGRQPRELAWKSALHYSIYNLDHMMDMCLLAERAGVKNLYSLSDGEGRSISKAVAYAAQWAGKPQSDFPYDQIGDWDDVQRKLLRMIRRSTLFEANGEYALFETNDEHAFRSPEAADYHESRSVGGAIR